MYKIKTLQTRGSQHELRCEDDFLVYEDERYIIASVFDGCSSGFRSDIASYNHTQILYEAIDDLSEYKNHISNINDFHLYSEKFLNLNWNENVSKTLLYKVYDKIFDEKFKIGEEMLSTVLLLVINKETGQFEITFCGDGVSFIKVFDEHEGEYTNVHDPEGGKVWYLSTAYDSHYKECGIRRNNSLPLNAPGNKCKTFLQCFEEYYKECYIIKGDLFETICISTDGIDTFKNKYGQLVDSRDYFCKNKKFDNLDNQLKRLYNIFTKGFTESKMPCMNFDDFTMIKVENIQ